MVLISAAFIEEVGPPFSEVSASARRRTDEGSDAGWSRHPAPYALSGMSNALDRIGSVNGDSPRCFASSRQIGDSRLHMDVELVRSVDARRGGTVPSRASFKGGLAAVCKRSLLSPLLQFFRKVELQQASNSGSWTCVHL